MAILACVPDISLLELVALNFCLPVSLLIPAPRGPNQNRSRVDIDLIL